MKVFALREDSNPLVTILRTFDPSIWTIFFPVRELHSEHHYFNCFCHVSNLEEFL